MIGRYDFFWNTMELCDWEKEGDDDQVLKPVIQYLSKQDDHVIFEFDDFMTELLYHLDTKKLTKQCEKVDPFMSDDTFLYSRCVALINGPAYYEKVGYWQRRKRKTGEDKYEKDRQGQRVIFISQNREKSSIHSVGGSGFYIGVCVQCVCG